MAKSEKLHFATCTGAASVSSQQADKELAKVQTFILDAVAPLTALLETCGSGETLTVEQVRTAATNALELIGNANARMSRLRHEKLSGTLNKSLQPPYKP